MGNQDEKNKDVKSKIEQIRIDLEKKLSAIEKSKIDTPIVEKSENDIKKSVVVNKEVKLENQVKPVFEITEPIESIKEEKIVPKVKQAIIVSKDTSKKEVNIIATEKSNKVVSNITKTAIVSKASDSKKVVLPTETNSKISTPPKTVISSLATSKTEIKPLDEVVEYEEKSKRGILSYLIYGLVIAFFLVLGYMFLEYMKEDKKVKNEIMEQKLSEFKNKRYLDSIELADLNYQLLDLQSKKMIDSLDLIYEKELLANSNLKDKKTAKRNFILNNPKNVEKRAARESKKNTDMPKGNDVADGNNSNDNGLNSSTKKTDDLVANTDTTINNNIEETESEKKTASTENLSKETDKALAEVAKKKKVIKSP
ncbi:MAG TPA: hypothetical protein EYP87_05070, partial [Flavobacteriaceae bacterium]|nr:hypothetical protein [Flavobacteriaceae bacterium]